jgi:hypothetical protein
MRGRNCPWDIRKILEAGQVLIFVQHAGSQPEEMRTVADAYDTCAGRKAARSAADRGPLAAVRIAGRSP